MNEWIPILSLVIAALAVVIGPVIAKQQINSAERVAELQVTAPLREAWIKSFRDLIVEISSLSSQSYLIYYNRELDNPELSTNTKKLYELAMRLQLSINPKEEFHIKLIDLVDRVRTSSNPDAGKEDTFGVDHAKLMMLAQSIMKTEWDRL